jgi:hypothetical protein
VGEEDLESRGNFVILTVSSFFGGLGFCWSGGNGSINPTPCSTREIISMGRNNRRAGVGTFFSKSSGFMDVLGCDR